MKSGRFCRLVRAGMAACLVVALYGCATESVPNSQNDGSQTTASVNEEPIEVTEIVAYTDEEIAAVIKTLKSNATLDEYLSEINERHGYPAMVAFHTMSSELQITANIPTYTYENGTFEQAYSGNNVALLFDGDNLKYIVIETQGLQNELAELYGLGCIAQGVASMGAQDIERAFQESMTREFAIVEAAQGYVFYDGVRTWAFPDESGTFAQTYDALDDDMASTPGIEALKRGDIQERQTFAYDSPITAYTVDGKRMGTMGDLELYERAMFGSLV